MSFISELKRRNVIRVALLYLVAGWIILQVTELLTDVLTLPEWTSRLVLALLVLGFVPALIFSWVYELTPEGLKREHLVDRSQSITTTTARKLDMVVGGLLVLAIGVLVFDRYAGRAHLADTAAQPRVPPPAAAAAARAGPASIAVLPFVNMSEDKSNDYFSDGLTEELLNVLAKVQGLRVIARTSSFAFKGKDATISEVAKALDVENVLEGSVRKSGDRVRITAQLIRAADSSHLWSETYDRTLQDVFAIQDEISAEVVDALKVRLLGPNASKPEVGGTTNAAAYEAYLQGLYSVNQGQQEAPLRQALRAFDQAIAEDPNYARAHAGRARVLSSLASNGYEPFDSGFGRARDAANRAIELEPGLAEAWLPLANITATVDLDITKARAQFERALTLDPGNAEVQGIYSNFALVIGLTDKAIEAGSKAVQLDPIAPRPHTALATAYYGARRYDEALAVARRAERLDPNFPGVHAGIGYVLLETGDLEQARAEFEKEKIEWQRLTGIALADAKLGRTQAARTQVATAQRRLGDSAAYQYAEINAQLGDSDEAFRWLEVARRIKDPGLSILTTDPLMDPLHKDPRFATLTRELGLSNIAASR
jgi:TolB-like protein/tetratricopeptide (TPR) repeat protein